MDHTPRTLDILFKGEADPYQTPAAMFILSDALCIELGVHRNHIRAHNGLNKPGAGFLDHMPVNVKRWVDLNGRMMLEKARTLHTPEDLQQARAEVAEWFQKGLERTWFATGTHDIDSYVFNNDFLKKMMALKKQGKLAAFEPIPDDYKKPDAAKVVNLSSIRSGALRARRATAP